MIAVYDQDGLGNVTSEKWFGGDKLAGQPGTGGGGNPCTTGLGVLDYELAHGYQFGVRNRTV